MSGFTKQAIQASFLKLLDTYPLRDIPALLEHAYFKLGVTGDELVARENSCGAAADYCDVVIFVHDKKLQL